MRNVCILMLIANVALTLVSLVVLPDRVAIHFGADGIPNGWSSNYVNALLMTATQVLLFCMLYFSPRLVVLLPAWCVNLPNKDYWLSPVRLQQAQKKLQHSMRQFGAVFLLYFLIMGLLALQANVAKPVHLNLVVFFTVLGLFLLYTLGWIYSLYRAFRIPAGARA